MTAMRPIPLVQDPVATDSKRCKAVKINYPLKDILGAFSDSQLQTKSVYNLQEPSTNYRCPMGVLNQRWEFRHFFRHHLMECIPMNASNPQVIIEALAWGQGSMTLEVFLEPTCPFSARAFANSMNS
jgi:hypothetical protein